MQIKNSNFVSLHGNDSYYNGQDIRRMSLEQINTELEKISYTEQHMDEYVKKNYTINLNKKKETRPEQ